MNVRKLEEFIGKVPVNIKQDSNRIIFEMEDGTTKVILGRFTSLVTEKTPLVWSVKWLLF